MSTELRQALERVARRFRQVRLWTMLAFCWLGWAMIGLWLVRTSRTGGMGSEILRSQSWLWTTLGAALTTAAICALAAFRSARDPRWVARRIEAKHPELNTGLLAAVEQSVESPARSLGFLQASVVRKALDHRRTYGWDDTVPTWRLFGSQVAHAVALGFLAVVSASLIAESRSHASGRNPFMRASDAASVLVEPGNTELERGSSLLVVARFPAAVPAEAHLVIDGPPSSADTSASAGALVRDMTRSLEDPAFATRVESVENDLTYRVEFEGRSTPTYRVKVFEFPELQRTDANLEFPAYTALKPKTVQDVRHVTAVEGTKLSLNFQLNKDVKSARLVDAKGGDVIPLTLQGSPNTEHHYQAQLTLADPKRFRVELVDHEGRKNKLTSELVVNVTRNRPAVVTITQPSRDVRVSPVEELTLKAKAEDDFGVVRHGVSFSIAGRPPQEVILSGDKPPTPAPRSVQGGHTLDFESFRAEPDQLASYHFWAEDIGPDGKPRRTLSDMFFAEVRHFEEIFRQGESQSASAEREQQQQGGQGQNAQQAEKLAELQKEIINGTWKVMRRETESKPSAEFAPDLKLLHESQQSAIGQAGEFVERLRDATSKEALAQATQLMKQAADHLDKAGKEGSTSTLGAALAAEQVAYQALLKLRAREFNVTRSRSQQRGQGGQASGGPSQQQLQQLELSNDENRYEEQSTAKANSPQQQQQRETRQVMNRLKELAQRQTDLNQRLKELQAALEAAQTAEAKQELERQLKRLREQEQQILRDTDELRERMEQEQNRERMAEARQQMEQSRENIRQASEALEQGRISQALTEGSRAERQLNDLREDMRKGAADRFSEELTEMRKQARQLDENQKKLTEQLESRNDKVNRSLRDTGEREQAKKGLAEQQKQLDGLLEQMRQTVQDAEDAEPLLAKSLFDTVRKANEQQIPDALKAAEQLAEAGIPSEAAKASRHAGQGLDQLREGVERAAESVLGDETAALERARAEVEDLAEQINREIAQATGQENPTDQTEPREGQRQQGQRQGRQQEGEPQQKGQQQGQGQGQQQQGKAQQKGQGQGQAQQKGQGKEQQQGQGQSAPQGKEQQKGQGQGQAQQKGQGQGQQQGQAQQKGQGQGQQQGQGQGQGQEQQQGQGQGQQKGQGSLRDGQGRQAQQQQGGGGSGSPGGSEIERLLDQLSNRRGGQPAGGPITGEGFRGWSDRMRDVEELLSDPELRSEAARIRDRVRGAREEFKRHSKEPDWTKLQNMVAEPIGELSKRIAEEIRKRESPDSLVPIDRDAVPPEFAEGVRRYYERLGSGQ